MLTVTPVRIQRKRKKGWKMPENTIYVGRPTKYGNPFKVGDKSPNNHNGMIDAQLAVALFEEMMKAKAECEELINYLKPLEGKNLACFCPIDTPCHADVLLKLANRQH